MNQLIDAQGGSGSSDVDAIVKFGMPEPIFFHDEEPARYRSMLSQVRSAVSPTDFVEEAWVRDVVDLLWEAIRYRRMKVAFLNAHSGDGLETLLAPIAGHHRASQLARAWVQRNSDAIEQVDDLLKNAGRTLEEARALTVSRHLQRIEAFDRLIAGAEARRTSVLREIDRRRAAFALALRSAVKPVEDADFELVGGDAQSTAV
jgi:hypothetical protein